MDGIVRIVADFVFAARRLWVPMATLVYLLIRSVRLLRGLLPLKVRF